MGGTGSTPPVSKALLLPPAAATERFCGEAAYEPITLVLPPWVDAAKAAGEIKTVS